MPQRVKLPALPRGAFWRRRVKGRATVLTVTHSVPLGAATESHDASWHEESSAACVRIAASLVKLDLVMMRARWPWQLFGLGLTGRGDPARPRSFRTRGVSICHIPWVSCTTTPRYKAYPRGYAEGLNDARTLVAEFFSILQEIRVPFHPQWMAVRVC